MPPNGFDGASAELSDGDWDAAPCGLLVLDEHDRVMRANRRFLELTGESWDDVAGVSFWNELVSVATRVGYLTQLAPILQLEGSLFEVMVDLRVAGSPTGETIPALLNARRTVDAGGRPSGARIAVFKIKDRRLYEDELRRARHEAERAREETERARRADAEVRRRIEFLADSSAALASSSDIETTLERLVRVVTESFADCCISYTPPPDDLAALSWTAAHRDPRRQPTLDHLAALLATVTAGSAFARVRDGGAAVLLDDLDTGTQEVDPEVLARLHDLGVHSALVVPSYARAEHIATLVAFRAGDGAVFTADDLTDLIDLAARTGVVLDNLRRIAREHSNSVTLQRAVLTVPPVTARAQIATRYLPATSGNDIGGDWYDAFVQPDGAVVLVVGDVMGHDITAAAAMGQLRGLIRTVGYITGATPAEILSRSDEAARGLDVDVLATVLIARIEFGQTVVLQWSNAGHPPPILLSSDSAARSLEASPDRPLGLGPALARARSDHRIELHPGDVLLIYTDGAVERPDEDYDLSLAALAGTVERARGLKLDELCDLVLETHADGTRDDIALLAIRIGD